MMLLPCPHCGPRNEDEFICWSEATPRRPADPSALSDEAWVDYVYNHDNIKGWSAEQWFHARGCGRWIVFERHTVTHEIRPAARGDD
ncbi:MAG: sarcosine oxidase subunit delta [Gammaproteobacteria bacterium]|nr:sarcosine oxidase subunit delta [Gammaproteobacteria bacterium]